MLRYLSVFEVAKVLSISRANAYALFRFPGFPVVKLGRRLLVSETALETWLNAGGTDGQPIKR